MGRPSSNQSDTPRAAATSSSSTAPTISSHQLAGCPRDSRSSPVRRATSRRNSRYAHSKDTSPTHAKRTTTKNGGCKAIDTIAARARTHAASSGRRPARHAGTSSGGVATPGLDPVVRFPILGPQAVAASLVGFRARNPTYRVGSRTPAQSLAGPPGVGPRFLARLGPLQNRDAMGPCSRSFGPAEDSPHSEDSSHPRPLCAAITSDATPPSPAPRSVR